MAIPSRVAGNRARGDPRTELDTDPCRGPHDSEAFRTEVAQPRRSPSTRTRVWRCSAARAQQVVHRQLVEPLEGHPARGGRLDVELLEGAPVGEQGLQSLAGGRLGKLVQARG